MSPVMVFVATNFSTKASLKYHPSNKKPFFVGLRGRVIVVSSAIVIGLTSLPPCVSNVIVNSFFGASGVSVLLQATKTHDKTIAIVTTAIMLMIRCFLNFITNLAKTYCRVSKIGKREISFPRDDKPNNRFILANNIIFPAICQYFADLTDFAL